MKRNRSSVPAVGTSSLTTSNNKKNVKKATDNIVAAVCGQIEFESCLSDKDSDIAISDIPDSTDNFDALPIPGVGAILRRSLSIRELDDNSWLSSSLIDLVLSKFASRYGTDVHFLPIDFVVFLMSTAVEDMKYLTDITGNVIDLTLRKPIVFIFNNQNMYKSIKFSFFFL